AVGVTESSAAAFLKLRCRAAASKARSACSGGNRREDFDLSMIHPRSKHYSFVKHRDLRHLTTRLDTEDAPCICNVSSRNPILTNPIVSLKVIAWAISCSSPA